ncbi:MetQ/NlpA family ABC transporter substrate-binding protein, partial [Streptomyces scabiei]
MYLKTFAKANHLKLSAIGETPTLGMGIYSKKITALSDLKSGDTVSLPNDPSNLARALQLLAAQKLITLKKNINVA